ncbi:MAG: CYTH domain-containing protein [Lentisphaeria bacterium]|nr:CYTH domain-containing protein [Lentisphaeria bacterium]
MPLEIEHKYLVKDSSWKNSAMSPVRMCQKYVALNPALKGVIRIRIAGEKAYLTLKTPQKDCVRGEYEYEIPLEDANDLMNEFCPGGSVDKLRYRVEYRGHIWEVDEFLGCYQGLVLAEIELKSPEESFELPAWAGEDVTGDFHYSNSYLAEHAK